MTANTVGGDPAAAAPRSYEPMKRRMSSHSGPVNPRAAHTAHRGGGAQLTRLAVERTDTRYSVETIVFAVEPRCAREGGPLRGVPIWQSYAAA